MTDCRTVEGKCRLLRYAAVLLAALVFLAPAPVAAQDASTDDAIIEHALEPWTGDLDGMIERGFIRLLTAYNPLYLNYNGFEQRGLAVEGARELEIYFRKTLGKPARNLNVVIIPVPRDQLIPRLLDGRGDVIWSNLTITPSRQEDVAFSDPSYAGVSELVVTGPKAKNVKSFDDLVPVGVHIRQSSSYFEHLSELNEQRKEAGKKPIPIELMDERLEDVDLLEMLNTGFIPAVIVDSHKMALWSQVFDNIEVHEDLAVNRDGKIAAAMRKNTPKFVEAMNSFINNVRQGSLLGNVLRKRYFSTEWIDNVTDPEARERFQLVADLMQRFAGEYGFDWLMIAAQGYQESKLDQNKRSRAGAIGVMQVLPTTAADPNVGIPEVQLTDKNIHAGVKYLRFLQDRYFDDQEIAPLDRVLLSFGAYNAGPANIARARKKAAEMGLDPNRWFDNVEVAAARTISSEPVTYVRNIYKYFVMYKKLEEAEVEIEGARKQTAN